MLQKQQTACSYLNCGKSLYFDYDLFCNYYPEIIIILEFSKLQCTKQFCKNCSGLSWINYLIQSEHLKPQLNERNACL